MQKPVYLIVNGVVVVNGDGGGGDDDSEKLVLLVFFWFAFGLLSYQTKRVVVSEHQKRNQQH